jgi:hypothetical protein
LYATAVMNVCAAVGFLPAAHAVRAAAGMPEAEHALYLVIVAMFVLLFGLGYLWSAVTGHADRLFIAIAAVGKLSFVTLLVGFWVAGGLPLRAPLAATGDLVFGLMFAQWLYGTRPLA